jgi:hypothetical protein
MTEQQPVDGRQRRRRRSRSKTSKKNPAASTALKRKWEDPEYRAKQSKHNKEVLPVGRRTRKGVPDGMTRAEAEPLWERARQQANTILTRLEKDGQIDFDNPDATENEMARIGLFEILVIALSPMGDQQLKNSAIRTVLLYTKPKPAVRSEIRLQQEVETAAWLRRVIDHHLATLPAEEKAAEC